MGESTIYTHEDYYKLIQILPSLLTENDRLIETENFEEYQNISLESLSININEIQNCISHYNDKEYKNVFIGYGNSFNKKEDTIAYIFDYIRMYIEYKKESFNIKNIWIDYSLPSNNSSICDLISFLNYIGEKYNLVLIDREANYITPLIKKMPIIEYFNIVFGFKQ